MISNQSFPPALLFEKMVEPLKFPADFPERKTFKKEQKSDLVLGDDSGLHPSVPPLASAFPTDVIDHGGTPRWSLFLWDGW